jgi:hypothetical protein
MTPLLRQPSKRIFPSDPSQHSHTLFLFIFLSLVILYL